MTQRQTQNVQIQLAIQTTQDGHTDNYAITEVGQAVKIGSQLYLRYQESNSHQKIKVLFKVSEDNLLTIKRSVDAQVPTKLVFNRQKDQLIDYPTAYGNLSLVTHTNKMRLLISQAPISGKIELDYSLISQNNLVADYKLRLIFK
jgi:uncharacterized beta-barrel protein YwiB (DUF1934 family)